jgi:hypothetical protein
MAFSQGIIDGPAFLPQEYQVLFLEIGGVLQTEIQSITCSRTDGGADVETLARDYAGHVKGAAKSMITFKGVIPYNPTDVTGPGFSNQGLMAGPAPSSGPSQLDGTMLTGLNQYNNQPVQFAILVGNPAVQQLVFKGFITELTVDSAVGKPADFTCKASGQFSLFS